MTLPNPSEHHPQLSPLAANAAQLHEIYRTYVGAGFTEHQAMQLLLTCVTANINRQSG